MTKSKLCLPSSCSVDVSVTTSSGTSLTSATTLSAWTGIATSHRSISILNRVLSIGVSFWIRVRIVASISAVAKV